MTQELSLQEYEKDAASLYSQHYADPEGVAVRWAQVLAAMGLRDASGCAAFDLAPSLYRHTKAAAAASATPAAEKQYADVCKTVHGCALPPGWTVDLSPDEQEQEPQQQQEQKRKAGTAPTVLKAQPPKTRIVENHPAKGDCLVAAQDLKAGTTVLTEASLLSAPQDPAHFFVAAAAARAVEMRSKQHFVVSRAAAAAAAFIRMCHQATGEDIGGSSGSAVSTSASGPSKNAASSFSIFRIMCPQWAAALIFNTIVRIGSHSMSAVKMQQQQQQQQVLLQSQLEYLAPGWEVVGCFSACSCGGVLEKLHSSSSGSASAALAEAKKQQQQQQQQRDAFRKVIEVEDPAAKRVRLVNEYRTARWAEWLAVAKLLHRVALRYLPAATSGGKENAATQEDDKKSSSSSTSSSAQLLFDYLSAGKTSSSTAAVLSDEALCALALDVNGFLSAAGVQAFVAAKAHNASRFLVGKSVLRAIAASSSSSSQQQQQHQQQQQALHAKPVQRLAYFLDALSSNAADVPVPGVPRRLAVFSRMRLCEHECRPACSVSFLDAPPLHGSAAFVAATQLQWDDPVHGCVITGGVRHAMLIQNEKVIEEVRHERSAAGHPMAAYGGACAVNLLLVPAVICVTTVRDVPSADPISIAYTPSAMMTWHERQKDLLARYGFHCSCIWCVGFAPDLARAFRCPRCAKGQGVVCPRSDGSQLDLWECIQCGFHPDERFVDDCCEAEQVVSRMRSPGVKRTQAPSTESGGEAAAAAASAEAETAAAEALSRLVDNEFLHYSHALVCRKLDSWAEMAWRQQEAETCISVVEVLLRCVDRLGTDDIDGFAAVIRGEASLAGAGGGGGGAASATAAAPAHPAMLPIVTEERAQRRRWTKSPPRDVTLAQYIELLGKANHAVGNAHTARYHYGMALAIRERSGQALSWWCRATRFMALTKSLADLMDSK